MTIYRIDLPYALIGKQRVRVTRRGIYTPPETVAAERALAQEAQAARVVMLMGPVALTVTIWIEPPASWSKAKRSDAMATRRWVTVKPDVDNVLKLVGDALNGIAWADDKQIASACIEKRYAANAATQIRWHGIVDKPEPVP
jgi:Holliday junction resolvase RusA-like endonuclease